MKKVLILTALLIISIGCGNHNLKRVKLEIENNIVGAPITLGIPFPKGTLLSADNVRLKTSEGKEIPCQVTKVNTWEDKNKSIKWIWLFFFSEKDKAYTLEYGKDIATIMQPEQKIISTNNMRPSGGIHVNTGKLSFYINKQGSGFLDEVYLDDNDNGKFEADELIASSGNDKRATFLDILDDAGIDASKATITQVFREKGSGPMHVIFRFEGMYHYHRADNNSSPFSIVIHAYSGKSYIKVLHTLTYTGVPDKHKKQKGEHMNIATQNKQIVSEQTSNDQGWMKPNDRISACGMTLKYHLDDESEVEMPIAETAWDDENPQYSLKKITSDKSDEISLLQTGPKYSGNSQHSFESELSLGNKKEVTKQRAKGWLDVSDNRRGISLGIKNFFEEYPKSIEINPSRKSLTGGIWPAAHSPMSFARKDSKIDSEMLDNFAQGVTKTTEFIYYFHKKKSDESIDETMDIVLNEPVAHAEPQWYMHSKVYGNMEAYSEAHPEFENALQYRFQWWAFSQKKVPWYGMFDYGDGKTYFIRNKWMIWTDNEPTVDFMLWTNFMRTGDSKYYHLAKAMSRHTMDVDNVHWPKKRTYLGDKNEAIDYWNFLDEPESTPYLGIGRRHAKEHWHALLSAHVWIQGWIADYYLSGDNRALEVAKMTGDTYIKRIWGEHDLRGRRLYLSVLNLVELYDATKLERYKEELDKRVKLMLEFQKEQGGNLLLDRYGYSQTYVAQGLYKYYQLTGNEDVKRALVEHAMWVRDVPPLNHKMESYLATIYPLLIGYEFTGRASFFNEAVKRAQYLKVRTLSKSIDDYSDFISLSDDLLKISNLPKKEEGFTNWDTNQGLRVFGWTHAYNIPYLLYWMDEKKK